MGAMQEGDFMVFNILLYVSLTIFVLGLIYKIYTWFSRKIGILAIDITTSERVGAALKGILQLSLYLQGWSCPATTIPFHPQKKCACPITLV